MRTRGVAPAVERILSEWPPELSDEWVEAVTDVLRSWVASASGPRQTPWSLYERGLMSDLALRLLGDTRGTHPLATIVALQTLLACGRARRADLLLLLEMEQQIHPVLLQSIGGHPEAGSGGALASASTEFWKRFAEYQSMIKR